MKVMITIKMLITIVVMMTMHKPFIHSFIHSFILNISIALLQSDYSGALPIPVRPKRKVFRWV